MSDDLQLVQAAKAGRSDAMSQLYDFYADPIYKFIFYKTMHRETAEDLTSQVFFKVLEKLATFDSAKSSFRTWLYTVARNTVIDHYRTQKQNKNIEDVWDLSSKEEVDEIVENRMQLEKVQEALKDLKPEQREVILLRLWQGMTYQEIAEATGRSESACKMTYSRAMKLVKNNIISLIFFALIINKF